MEISIKVTTWRKLDRAIETHGRLTKRTSVGQVHILFLSRRRLRGQDLSNLRSSYVDELRTATTCRESGCHIRNCRHELPFSSFSLNLSTDTQFPVRITTCFYCAISNLSHPDVALIFLQTFDDFSVSQPRRISYHI